MGYIFHIERSTYIRVLWIKSLSVKPLTVSFLRIHLKKNYIYFDIKDIV